MSIILAKIFGLYFLVLGLAFLINPDQFRRICQQTMKDENFLFFGGILGMLIGAFVISVHNIWVLAWPVILTLLGWWSLAKGSLLLTYPESFNKAFSFIQNRSNMFYRMINLFYLVLGIFLVYKGWL